MSAPSDGARADARKARAANVPPIDDMRRLPDLLHTLFPCGDTSDLDAPPCWTGAQTVLASDWLAGVIADAKAEALSQAESDLNREAVDFQTGWGSNEIDQAKLWAIGRCLAWLRRRASAEESGR